MHTNGEENKRMKKQRLYHNDRYKSYISIHMYEECLI